MFVDHPIVGVEEEHGLGGCVELGRCRGGSTVEMVAQVGGKGGVGHKEVGEGIGGGIAAGLALPFLFDALDSGLSIDAISEMKTDLFQFVIEQNPDKDVYIIVSANGYEFANGERCYDVANCKEITFKDYDDYRKFILKSKEQKNKRNKKWFGE